MSNLDKIVMSKENKWNTKLNKLNNDVKKLKIILKKIMIKKLIKKKNWVMLKTNTIDYW